MTHNAISFSEIQTFRRCPNKYRYSNVLGLQRKARPTQLYQGILVHEALMTYYLSLRDGLDGTHEVWDFFEDAYGRVVENQTLFSDPMADELKIVEDSEDLVRRYLDKWADEWEILHVEEQFIVQMDDGPVVSFTPDLVVKDRNGFVWIVDHKTTSSLPSGEIPAGDLQAVLYYAGVKTLYPELRGFIFNKLRKKRPTQPKLTKTGKLRVADLDRIDTSYEVLRDFITNNAPQLMDDDRHRRRLAKLRDQENFFWREQVVITEEQADTTLYEAGITIKIMEQVAEGGWYPRTMQEDRGWGSCSRCEFNRICQAELLNWDVDRVLEDYEPRGPKNPYEAEGE
jgi:hypothetical protein